MTDATGHMDRPGSGTVFDERVCRRSPTNHYTHENPKTRRIEVVKSNPPGVPDLVVKEFDDRGAARLWIRVEFLAGRLR